MDNPIKGIFPNVHIARRLLNPPKWTPPLGPNDPTFPSTPSQDVHIVREIHAALRESGPFWRSGGAHVAYRQCGLLKLPRVLETGDEGFADAWLEAVAWEALEKMKTLYREGYTAPTDPTNQVSPDRALSFFNRLCALCSLLRDWKSACDMMAGPAQDYACVALPLSYRKAFEHRAHEELQHAQQLVAHDPSMMTNLADLARKAAECGLFQVPLLPALPLPDATGTDLGKFNLDVALVDAAGLEQFLRKQASASLFTNQVVTEVEEHSPPSKRRKIVK
ncbi:hypothetical protein IWZ00DRAFT_545114 [Phyllosticta capitalensis]|uniref:uncharacterized protein n=1 Tax=Phyllosticta capitalensis TaxID=121624 RepID=UPI00312E8C4C